VEDGPELPDLVVLAGGVTGNERSLYQLHPVRFGGFSGLCGAGLAVRSGQVSMDPMVPLDRPRNLPHRPRLARMAFCPIPMGGMNGDARILRFHRNQPSTLY